MLPPARARRLIGILSAVVAVDWVSKALAWRLLPGSAMINADTSGALPILSGLVAHPVLGAVVDAGAMLLLVIAGLWLAQVVTLGKVAWIGFALAWAGIAANAFDRWGGHLWLAPGSKRGVVDWIGVADNGAINLADVTIGIGLLLAIAALAGTRIPRGSRAAAATGILLLVPFSMLTASGVATNAELAPVGLTLPQRVRAAMWVGEEDRDQRALWRVSNPGWDVSARAVDRTGLVLAQWHSRRRARFRRSTSLREPTPFTSALMRRAGQ